MSDLPISSLVFSDIKNNLINYLKTLRDENNNYVYEDYNFTGSGINTLLNLLSYNTHILGYYTKMLLNETFIDSALLRESLFSKAKLVGYIPKGKTSSTIKLKLSVELNKNVIGNTKDQPSGKKILVPKGTTFSSINNINDSRTFNLLDDIYIKNIIDKDENTVIYYSDYFDVYEGSYQKWSFVMDYDILDQHFLIKDSTIDIDTMSVFVRNEGSSEEERYVRSTNVINVATDSKVFYLSTNFQGYYEIFFGDNYFGKKPENRCIIDVYYLSSNGKNGNGSRQFRMNAPDITTIPIQNNINNWEDIVITLSDRCSYGGADEESVDKMRFSIPKHYKRQNRLVTKEDYREIIMSDIRDIHSINVWGGEENYIKEYGKIFICIKPKYINKLTELTKQNIINNIIKRQSIVGLNCVIVDPDITNIKMNIYVKVKRSLTNDTVSHIETIISSIIDDYNENELNKFETFFSESKLMKDIMYDKSILSAYSEKTLHKDINISYNLRTEYLVLFGNSIKTGCYSNSFNYANNVCHYEDDNGYIYIYKNDNTKLSTTSYGSVDYDNGVIKFNFPELAYMVGGSLTDNNGTINWSVIPLHVDIETYLNNILVIDDVKIHIRQE